MMQFCLRYGLLLGIVLLAGCSSVDRRLVDAGLPKGGPVLEAAATLAVLNYVYQPLDANWDIVDQPLNEHNHRLALRMKRFSTGGEGEAWSLVKRYAERLQAEKGAGGFVVVEFTSGIDSSTPFARRVAEAVVRFSELPAAPRVAEVAAFDW